MAHKRLDMQKLQEILRLKYECGLSDRQVKNSCGVSRRTISIYWQQAQLAGIDWNQDKNLNDTDLEQRLFNGRSVPEKTNNPDWNYIYKELKRPHVTLQLLWQEYKESNPGGCHYSWFQEQFAQWRKKINICMR